MKHSMSLTDFYEELKVLEDSIKLHGLNPEVYAHINWVGDAISIKCKASEPYKVDDGYWHGEKNLYGTIEEVPVLLSQARQWCNKLPSEEDRAIEIMVRKLTQIADSLPEGSSDVARAMWMEIKHMILGKAERISKNGLPPPNRVTQLEEVK